MASLAEFNGQIEAFMDEQVPRDLLTFVRTLSLEALRRIVQKMPVDTGRARGSVQVTSNAPAVGETDRLDTTGSQTLAEGIAQIEAHDDAYGVVYVTSNLDYILALENGHSGQAPNGMFAVTIAEIEAAFP